MSPLKLINKYSENTANETAQSLQLTFQYAKAIQIQNTEIVFLDINKTRGLRQPDETGRVYAELHGPESEL